MIMALVECLNIAIAGYVIHLFTIVPPDAPPSTLTYASNFFIVSIFLLIFAAFYLVVLLLGIFSTINAFSSRSQSTMTIVFLVGVFINWFCQFALNVCISVLRQSVGSIWIAHIVSICVGFVVQVIICVIATVRLNFVSEDATEEMFEDYRQEGKTDIDQAAA
jgi:magnesium-transporting ATPase (P-type)